MYKLKATIRTVVLILCFVVVALKTLSYPPAAQATEKQNWENLLATRLEQYPEAIITIGQVTTNDQSYEVYGADKFPYTYEIGSITKTMTAAMVEQAIIDQKIDLDAEIDHYLPLTQYDSYPTIRQLLTHTSGYPSFYFKPVMVSNLYNEDNAYYQIDRQAVITDIESHDLGNVQAEYSYANFNYAVLGLVLEEVYGDKFIHLINQYLKDLGLGHTSISTEFHNLANYESYSEDDAYLAAGQVSSNIEEMLFYLQVQLTTDHPILEENISDFPETKHVGYGWHFHENGIVWHNGATAHYNAFVAFHPESQQGVVVLINLPVGEGVSATELGQQILFNMISSE